MSAIVGETASNEAVRVVEVCFFVRRADENALARLYYVFATIRRVIVLSPARQKALEEINVSALEGAQLADLHEPFILDVLRRSLGPEVQTGHVVAEQIASEDATGRAFLVALAALEDEHVVALATRLQRAPDHRHHEHESDLVAVVARLRAHVIGQPFVKPRLPVPSEAGQIIAQRMIRLLAGHKLGGGGGGTFAEARQARELQVFLNLGHVVILYLPRESDPGALADLAHKHRL